MRKLLLIILLALPFHANAQEHKLHIIMKSGSHVSIPIAEQPKISFSNGVISVGSEDFQVSNVSKYLFGTDEVLGVNAVARGEILINADDANRGNVSIINYKGEMVKLYAANGIELPVKVTVTGNEAKVDYTNQPAGIYILSVGEETIKFKKQ